MSHFNDFMEGVPVKISERYKRPPRIELPYSVSECTSRAQNVVDNSYYRPTFETNVLSKIKELKNAKQTKKTERRHRVQLLEEAKQKKLDAIAAAEAEEKLKQLSVSEVSYPSTDEISALSPDENPENTSDLTPTKDHNPKTLPDNNTDVNIVTYNNISEQQSNILQPIQVQSIYQQNNLLDDPDPLQQLTRSTKITKIPQFNHNIESLTVKDFENDTSSPFDSVELKTINEMELLAQVLQSQRDSHLSCEVPNTYNQNQCFNEVTPCVPPDYQVYPPNSYPCQSVPTPVAMYSSPQHYPSTNGYYMPNENTCDTMMTMENDMYMHNYQYYVPVNPYTDPAYGYQTPIQTVGSQTPAIHPSSTYIPQPFYFQPPQVPPQASYNPVAVENVVTEKPLSPIQIKSRSRSVPDIVKELDEQINLARQERAKAAVLTASPTTQLQPSCSRQTKDERRLSKRKSDILPNPFDQLSQKLQSICQKIHGMGFPLDRVARVCTHVGDNDKKIIEGLLIMGELMDLGFSERKVSAALAKHEFHRDKALDELVS